MTLGVHETINQSSEVFILLFCPGKIISSIQELTANCKHGIDGKTAWNQDLTGKGLISFNHIRRTARQEANGSVFPIGRESSISFL
jgi:hypothetical protein